MEKKWSEIINLIMEKKCLTQRELANELKVSFSTITRWLNGSRIPTQNGIRQKIRKIYNEI